MQSTTFQSPALHTVLKGHSTTGHFQVKKGRRGRDSSGMNVPSYDAKSFTASTVTVPKNWWRISIKMIKSVIFFLHRQWTNITGKHIPKSLILTIQTAYQWILSYNPGEQVHSNASYSSLFHTAFHISFWEKGVGHTQWCSMLNPGSVLSDFPGNAQGTMDPKCQGSRIGHVQAKYPTTCIISMALATSFFS